MGGRPDSVQVMLNRRHLYVGHMFSNGVTILDAADPRNLKPVGFFTAGVNTRTHHLQVAEDLLLLANGANIIAMQSYDNMRGYFENTLVDSITNRKKFRSGLSIHDISRPSEMKEIAFLEMPGLGVNRLWWPGGRYAYVSAHFDGFTDHILCIVDLREMTKPVFDHFTAGQDMDLAVEKSSQTEARDQAVPRVLTAVRQRQLLADAPGKTGQGGLRIGTDEHSLRPLPLLAPHCEPGRVPAPGTTPRTHRRGSWRGRGAAPPTSRAS